MSALKLAHPKRAISCHLGGFRGLTAPALEGLEGGFEVVSTSIGLKNSCGSGVRATVSLAGRVSIRGGFFRASQVLRLEERERNQHAELPSADRKSKKEKKDKKHKKEKNGKTRPEEPNVPEALAEDVERGSKKEKKDSDKPKRQQERKEEQGGANLEEPNGRKEEKNIAEKKKAKKEKKDKKHKKELREENNEKEDLEKEEQQNKNNNLQEKISEEPPEKDSKKDLVTELPDPQYPEGTKWVEVDVNGRITRIPVPKRWEEMTDKEKASREAQWCEAHFRSECHGEIDSDEDINAPKNKKEKKHKKSKKDRKDKKDKEKKGKKEKKEQKTKEQNEPKGQVQETDEVPANGDEEKKKKNEIKMEEEEEKEECNVEDEG